MKSTTKCLSSTVQSHIAKLCEITDKHEQCFSYENRVKNIVIDRIQHAGLNVSKNQRLMNTIIKEIICGEN